MTYLSSEYDQPVVTVEVFIDLICPWCYIGKRRLEATRHQLRGEVNLEIVWRPFELNPEMPREGVSRRAYRTAKFGSWERSQALDARVREVGREDGLEFAFDRMEWTPNTLDAHRLVALAQQEGLADALVENLFHAYFTDGRDIGDPEVLATLASAAGLPPDEVRHFLNTEEGLADIREQEQEARFLELDGVPAFILNRGRILTGAQPAENLVRAILLHFG